MQTTKVFVVWADAIGLGLIMEIVDLSLFILFC